MNSKLIKGVLWFAAVVIVFSLFLFFLGGYLNKYAWDFVLLSLLLFIILDVFKKNKVEKSKWKITLLLFFSLLFLVYTARLVFKILG